MFTFAFLCLIYHSGNKALKRYKRLVIIFSSILAMVVLFAKCMDFKHAPPATERTYAGAATCKQCHAQIVESYLQNPHQQTSSSIENDQLTSGPLPHAAVYAFDQHLKLVVEKRDSGMYQVVYFEGKEQAAQRFDVRIGSGEKAHTYGSWQGNQLKQLPLSYFRMIQSWANSPGYPANKVFMNRPIGIQCLECHSSFVDFTSVPDGSLKVKEVLKRTSLIYGIDCERCHGPAGKHVEFHLDHPEEKTAKFISIYKTLSRQQKTDACAVCHSGTDTERLKSTFQFKPGDKLEDFHSTVPGVVSKNAPDVHGNQTNMLEKSQCYIQSKTLECGSCHRTHENLKGNLTAYSQKCISCHATATIKHSPATLANALVKTNCIDCHMPKQASNLISFQLAGQDKKSPYLLRTHKIAVYQ